MVDEKVFWDPAPLNTKSWADVDDADDDDYYATNAPPVAVWGSNEDQVKEESPVHVEVCILDTFLFMLLCFFQANTHSIGQLFLRLTELYNHLYSTGCFTDLYMSIW